ncbi:MAG: zinc ribbon domain-containing protein [Ruminococcus sp.]|nr:zinc ribbon domain-containing protein [Ruminococcus sp.]
MFCPKCGAQNPDSNPFCTSCGTPLSQQTYQQPYQQPAQPKPPRPALPEQPFTSQGIINTFLANVTNPRSCGLPQFIAFGTAFFYFISMLMPYVSYGGYGSTNYFSAGASAILPAIFLIILVSAVAFTKNGVLMIEAGTVFFFFTLFRATSISGVNISVGCVFMMLSSLGTIAAGVLQFLAEKKG